MDEGVSSVSPFEKAELNLQPWKEFLAHWKKHITPFNSAVKKQLFEFYQEHKKANVFKNDLYTVIVDHEPEKRNEDFKRPLHGVFSHLSIKRNDKGVITDWESLNSIKEALLGQRNAVELFPLDNRLVDMANQYHLWAIKDPERSIGVSIKKGAKMASPSELYCIYTGEENHTFECGTEMNDTFLLCGEGEIPCYPHISLYENSLYLICVNSCPEDSRWINVDKEVANHFSHIHIERKDRLPVHDWRELQDIKNIVVGKRHEAIELYPSSSLHDKNIQGYHLWALKKEDDIFSFGFLGRSVSGASYANDFGGKQRDFNEK